MAGALKKGVLLLVVLFLVFWLVQDPNGFAASAKDATGTISDVLARIWELLVMFFDSVIRFFKSLSS